LHQAWLLGRQLAAAILQEVAGSSSSRWVELARRRALVQLLLVMLQLLVVAVVVVVPLKGNPAVHDAQLCSCQTCCSSLRLASARRFCCWRS
jgi:hypothetical protein